MSVALSEFEQKRIEKLLSAYCDGKVPPHLRDQIRIEFRIRGNEASLFESRPHFRGTGEWFSVKIARFRKDPQTETWQLHWADRNSRWRSYEPLPYHRDMEELLDEVKRDATGVFWG